MMQRFSLFILICVCILASKNVAANEEAYEFVDKDGGVWAFDNIMMGSSYPDYEFDYCDIFCYSGDSAHVEIPSIIVIYDGNNKMKRYVPSSIRRGTFKDCQNLQSVTFPKALNSIDDTEPHRIILEDHIFDNCPKLKEIVFMGKGSDYRQIGRIELVSNCDNLEKVVFVNGCSEEFFNYYIHFGDSNPTIYISNNYIPDTWYGYPTADLYTQELLAKCILRPETDGEIGQLLTKTADGHSWMTFPIDDKLDAASGNAITNSLLTSLYNELQGIDNGLLQSISELQDKNRELAADITTNHESIATNLETIGNLEETIQSHETQIGLTTATVAENELAIAENQSSISAIQEENVNRDNAIAALQADNEELKSQLSELLLILNSGKSGQVLTRTDEGFAWMDAQALGYEMTTMKLKAGWNLVAMPGRIMIRESERALLEHIKVFSYDKTMQCYLEPEEILPLASYWFYTEEDCILHFAIVAPDTDDSAQE